MDKSLRNAVNEAFHEFVKDFVTSYADIDKDILNYSNKYFEDEVSKQLFCMELGLQLMVYQLSKYLAIFNPEVQNSLIDNIENKLRKEAVGMHDAWLKHREKYQE